MRPDEGGAGAVLEVDLRAIVANWRLLGSLHPSGPVAGVVKADGYGLEIGRASWRERVCLAV